MATRQFRSEMLDLDDDTGGKSAGRWKATASRLIMPAVLALLVLLFLFVPLLQGFQLSAGQDVPARNDPARAADRLAAAEVGDLVRER